MDLPNITLFFQMANFAVAYFLLRKFVCTPALQIIVSKESYQQNLEQKIATVQATHHDCVEEKQARWIFMRKSLSDMTPNLKSACTSQKALLQPTQVDILTLSAQQRQEVVNVLRSKLSDVKV